MSGEIRPCSKEAIYLCIDDTPILCNANEVGWEIEGEVYCVDPSTTTLADIINGRNQIRAEIERAQKAWESMPKAVTDLKKERPRNVEYTTSEKAYSTQKNVRFYFKDSSIVEVDWSDHKKYPFIRRGYSDLFPAIMINGQDTNIDRADFLRLNEHIY